MSWTEIETSGDCRSTQAEGLRMLIPVSFLWVWNSFKERNVPTRRIFLRESDCKSTTNLSYGKIITEVFSGEGKNNTETPPAANRNTEKRTHNTLLYITRA